MGRFNGTNRLVPTPCRRRRPRRGDPGATLGRPLRSPISNPARLRLLRTRMRKHSRSRPEGAPGRHKGVPYIRPNSAQLDVRIVPCTSAACCASAPRPRGGNSHGTKPARPLTESATKPCRGDPCGRPRWIPALRPVHRDGTPQGRPLPPPDSAQTYIRVVPCASAPRPRGGNSHGANPPVDRWRRRGPVGRGLSRACARPTTR